MGALTTDRKRGVDYFTLNHKFPSLYSPEPNPSVDTHISKKPKIALSMHLTPDRPNSSESAASRLSHYPKAIQRLRRELHAPFRALKFGLSSSSRPNTRSDSADAMGNVLVHKYEKAKAGAISSLRYLNKDDEVIDVKAETVKDDVSEDSSIEVVGGREQRSVDSEQRSRESNGILANYIELDDKVAERSNVQPSSSSVVSDLTNSNSKVLELRVPDTDSDSSGVPLHKKLHDSAERRNGKLSSLGFQIKLNEALRAVLQLLRPKKKPEEVVVREPFVPLTKEEEAEITRAFSGSNRRKVWVSHENSNIEITGEKLQCLRPGAWLNDEVINLYLELLKEREKREPSKYLKCHFFNTFFYKKLFNGRSGYDFKSVRRWTSQRKLGYCLLECDKIFVPIHKEVHWCLAVINKKDEKFQYLDSLRGVDEQVLKVLARYFVDEVKDKSGQDIDVSSWEQEYVEDLPEQENGFDCGMFMIKYADFYSRDVGLCFKQEHMPYFRLRTAKEILRLKAE